MTIRSQLLVAAALVAGAAGLQATAASAMPGFHVSAVAHDGATVQSVRYVCTWNGCYHTGSYRYGYRYGHRSWGYAYNPYGYGYALPGVRVGFY